MTIQECLYLNILHPDFMKGRITGFCFIWIIFVGVFFAFTGSYSARNSIKNIKKKKKKQVAGF